MKKDFLCYFLLLMLSAFSARAELSANPWLEPNTAEDIAEVYNDSNEGQNPQAVPDEVAKTYTRIQENRSSGESVLDKVKGMFHSKETVAETPQEARQISQNQQVLARRRSLRGKRKSAVRSAPAESGGGILDGVDMPSPDFSGIVDKVKGFNFKSLTNAFK